MSTAHARGTVQSDGAPRRARLERAARIGQRRSGSGEREAELPDRSWLRWWRSRTQGVSGEEAGDRIGRRGGLEPAHGPGAVEASGEVGASWTGATSLRNFDGVLSPHAKVRAEVVPKVEMTAVQLPLFKEHKTVGGADTVLAPILSRPAHGGYGRPPRSEGDPRGPREAVGVFAAVEAAGRLRLRSQALRRGARGLCAGSSAAR